MICSAFKYDVNAIYPISIQKCFHHYQTIFVRFPNDDKCTIIPLLYSRLIPNIPSRIYMMQDKLQHKFNTQSNVFFYK